MGKAAVMLQPTLGKPNSAPPPPFHVLQVEPEPATQPSPALKSAPLIEESGPVPLVRQKSSFLCLA